ncbi:multicopper oxidase domain-containing protein [Candidatus Nitrosopumilus sediminis]|uniref:Copper-containing nitrite reductase n=1 Tax=Candidatus Nitrosopumilus sediminis TaxID=1229909 RepID=K0BCD0_9ARCH|nr:multicopper oxidase domain-containing protein [Candidatus Nitrosopumilus sediminis]AFS83134.1 multicopper oxidase type 3 [Candidatus Nitrosopumilus sediminis]
MDRTIVMMIAVISLGVTLGLVFLTFESPIQSFAENTSIHNPPTTHNFTVIAEDTTLEIAPGIRVEAWTYNGTIPGPTLRATEGDRVIINFINNGKLPHTMHFHGDHNEKNDGVFQEVLPGESYIYDFVAEPAGTFMYHCHVMPVSEHVRNGLYGAFIVDPKEGLEPAREYVLVKGEYDLEDQETWTPDYVFFNGYADQYWSNPLPAKTGELVRLYYVDMGAIPAYGFHIHGTIFDTIISGIWENEPIKTQTWEVGPGNAAIFEATWKEPGRYLFHLHGIPEEKGTMGYFDVRDASSDAIDGVNVSKNKSIDMWNWQKQISLNLQIPDKNAKVTETVASTSNHEEHSILAQLNAEDHQIIETTLCDVEEGSAIKSSNKSFYPKLTQIQVGDTITWTNKDNSVHTVTSNDGLFDSGMMMPGDTFDQTFEDVGLYEYYCMLHPWMTGAVKSI